MSVIRILKKISIPYSRVRHFAKAAAKISATGKKKWQPVIGLEIHAQILTESKLFSGAGTKFAAPINNQVSHFDAALPGTLPVLNKSCVEAAVLTAMALSCHINLVSKFDRKHYFYADLPAGYQITQQRQPIAVNGHMNYMVYSPHRQKKAENKMATIIQVQLEQDSGKSLHDPYEGYSLIDLNRAGVGLMEIVTAPDFSSGEEAAAFVRELQLILQALGTCDGKMQEGSLRVDANISVHQPGEPLGVRTEVKNLNSIKYVTKAIEYEISRQTKVLESGGEIINETRSFDFESGETIVMRDKERLQDYRFMPEPNLPPLCLYTSDTVPQALDETQVVNIDKVRERLVELPHQLRMRLEQQYGLTLEQAITIVNEPGVLEYFEEVMSGDRNVKTVAKMLLNELFGLLNKQDIDIAQCPITPLQLGELVDLIDENMITIDTARHVLRLLYQGESHSARQIVIENGLTKITDLHHIGQICDEVINANEKAVRDYKRGKTKVMNFFIGTVQKLHQYRIDHTVLIATLKEKLK